jgi:hypothetical protein
MFSSAINPPAIEYTADESARNATRVASLAGGPDEAFCQQFLDGTQIEGKTALAVPSPTWLRSETTLPGLKTEAYSLPSDPV